MSKPKFSFEAADPIKGGWYLKLKVQAGGKETTWSINFRTTNQQLYQILGEIMMEIDPLEQALRVPEKLQQDPDTPEDPQMSEAGSAELRAAKARQVDKTGKTWFSNLELGEELPLYTIGHDN